MIARLPLRGIREKLLVSFSLLLASIALFVIVFFPARLERQAMRASVAKAEAIRDMAAYSVTAGLLFGDTVAIREVLQGVARNPDIQALIVRDTAGHIVAARPSTPAGSRDSVVTTGGFATPDGRTYVTSTRIIRTEIPLGTLTVRISLAELRREVAMAQRLGVLVGVLIFITGFIAVYAISALVTRPLMAVSQTVKRIAAGDLQLRAVVTSNDEVAQFVRAFNQMVDSLVGAQADLAAINQGLEARVDERTSELRHAIALQRNAQHALAESEAQARSTSETLQSLIDVAPQAIVTADLDWRVTQWNKAAERLFGWTAGEVIGRPVPYIGDAERKEFAKGKLALSENAEAKAEERVRKRKDGSSVSVLVSGGRLLDDAQRPIGYIGVLTDLTERKLLEEQLRQSQKMEAIGQLAGGVAHDFNNILTVITSCAAMLLEDERDSDKREDLDQISIAASRAAALTRQLLTFSRKQIVQLQPVDIDTVVQEMEPMLQRLLYENIQLRTNLVGALPPVVGDPSQIQQVIMNLVVNASDAMPGGGILTIATKTVEVRAADTLAHPGVAAGHYVKLVVSDTGIGMAASTINRIFEPFFTTKEIGRGTGLGLATAYAVVTQLRGHIGVFSEPGCGTTFKIYLPYQISDAPAVPAAAPAPEATLARTGQETILLVEDEDAVRRSVRRVLEQQGYSVIEANSGEAGLAVAAAFDGTIDVLVTDIMMPGMNGRTVADALLIARPRVSVVFMSGYTDDSISQSGLVDATHAFLQKPFTGKQLSAALHSLRRTPAFAEA